ncbi:hypothetical protein V1512DRAFT_266238 [Lipomyces arxii]|uniref:uncharacterized protein n=1 Tax=Lipomyces arxii TaxID=56418 RepID=UPI0034CF2F1D
MAMAVARLKIAQLLHVFWHFKFLLIAGATILLVVLEVFSGQYSRANVSSVISRISPGAGYSLGTDADIHARNCEDPYRLPGYLYTGEHRNDTRWIPFYDDFSQLEPLPETDRNNKEQTIILADSGPGPEFLERAPTTWMRKLMKYQELLQGIRFREEKNRVRPLTASELKLQREMSWIHHRRVLLVGDSIDRILLRAVCTEFGVQGVVEGPGIKQATLYCEFPLLNFTISQWHVASMITYKPDWWWVANMEVVAFEDRFENIFNKFEYRSHGKSGSPDLVLFQSGRWDLKAFGSADLVAAGKEPHLKGYWDTQAPLKWNQLRYMNARLQKLIGMVRDKFDKDFPLMFRSLPVGKDRKSADLGVMSVDRMIRSMSNTLDFEIFDWSSIVYGYPEEYTDEMHIKQGKLSWVFGDMLFYYLFRASGGLEVRGDIVRLPDLDKPWDPIANWAQCHSFFVKPVNR